MFELGDGPEDLKEHPPDRDGGVDALVEDDQVDTTARQVLGQLVEVLEGNARAGQVWVITSWSPARATRRGLVEFGPASEPPGDLVDMHLVTPEQ